MSDVQERKEKIMVICHSGKSAISANLIADEDDNIFTNRGADGDVNFGRFRANTRLNPDISNSTNKRRMRELFREHDVPMPTMVDPTLAFGPWSDNKPIVGRPDTHSQGRGFWLCKSNRDVYKALAGTRKKKPATHFMEFVEADREYRVHIFKGKSIRISEKVFFVDPDTQIVDKGTYYTGKPKHPIKHVRKAAKKAVEALGLDFGAVDILATDDECWVLEVNAAPGLGGSMPRLYADVFNQWFRGERA